MLQLTALATALLAAEPTLIQQVSAARSDRRLDVEVVASSPIDLSSARAVVGDRTLTVRLPGARVRQDNRSWTTAEGREIRAHRHRGEIELAVPLREWPCAGPASLTTAGTGLKVSLTCRPDDSNTTSSVTAPGSAVASVPARLPVGQPVAPQAAAPVPPPQPSPAALAASGQPPPPSVRVSSNPTAKAAAAQSPVAPNQSPSSHSEVSAPPALDLDRTAQPSDHTSASGSALLRAVTPALVLIAVVAFFWARRRTRIAQRYVTILETTSLGPKRSLIVARIGGEVVYLGSSEAGISLLPAPQTQQSAATSPTASSSEVNCATEMEHSHTIAVAAPVASPRVSSVEESEQAADLIRLFQPRKTAQPASFSELLEEETNEDRELRRKLAMGIGGRVP